MMIDAVTSLRRLVLPSIGGVLLLVASIVVVGCGGTSDPAEESFLTTKIDGLHWEASSWVVGRSNGEIFITANFLSDLSISFTVDGEEEGTYPLGVDLSSAMLVDGDDAFIAEGVLAGELRITRIGSDRIEGSFGFTAKDPDGIGARREVTNGRFSLPFLEE